MSKNGLKDMLIGMGIGMSMGIITGFVTSAIIRNATRSNKTWEHAWANSSYPLALHLNQEPAPADE